MSGLPDEVVNGIEVWVYIGELATWFILSSIQPCPSPIKVLAKTDPAEKKCMSSDISCQ